MKIRYYVQTQPQFSSYESLSKSFDIKRFYTLESDPLKSADIYLVEVDETQKDELLRVKEFFLKREGGLLYLINTSDTASTLIYQLAMILKANGVFAPSSDTLKMTQKIQLEYKNHYNDLFYKKLGKTLYGQKALLIFENNVLVYANKKALHLFGVGSTKELPLLDVSKESIVLQNKDGKKSEIRFDCMQGSKIGEIFVLCHEVLYKKHNEIDFIQNRINFTESLKDKMLEMSISQEHHIGMVCIVIENLSKLQHEWKSYDVEMVLRDVLLEVNIILQEKTAIAHYENNLYLIVQEGKDFEALKQSAQVLFEKINIFVKKLKITPMIGLYVLDISKMDLNTTIATLNKLHESQNLHIEHLHYIPPLLDELDDAQMIDFYFKSIVTNKTPIKLLSIYKGVCINTASAIKKYQNDEIHVSFEALQGNIMHLEKETIIQSPSFSKDIKADVRFLDFDNKIAVLHNFVLLQGSVNSRKYSRVTSSQRTPIVVSYFGGAIHGEIADLSVKSIAIKSRIGKYKEGLEHKDVELSFTLPTSLNLDGYVKMNLYAKVIIVACDDEFCKIVTDLSSLEQSDESVLMEYVYNRQKEIIGEIKKISKKI